MATKKHRHHFIPRFLLNRFASRSDPARGKYKVWEHSASHQSGERSTKDVGVGRHFHGSDADDLENALSISETRFSETLAKLDQGIDPNSIGEELTEFVWIQTVRTRALRDQFQEVADRFVDIFGTYVATPLGIDSMKRYLTVESDNLLDVEIAKLPEPQRSIARASLTDRMRAEFRRQLLASANSHTLQQNWSGFATLLKSEKVNSKAAKNGQIRALRRLVERREIPDVVKPRTWKVIETIDHGVILGDACTVWLESRSEAVSSYMKFGKDWDEVYFPISSRQILAGYKHSNGPSLDVAEINLWSARIASDAFYSASEDSCVTCLIPWIGTENPSTGEDMNAFIEEKLPV